MNASRHITVLAIAGAIFITQSSGVLLAGDMADPSARLLRDASLMLLKEGNQRFATGKPQIKPTV